MIDDIEVEVGDEVFDLMLRFGTVTEVESDGSFTVLFSGKRKMRYSAGGYLGQLRRVYWNNPMVVAPRKNDKNWPEFQKIANSLYNMVVRN